MGGWGPGSIPPSLGTMGSFAWAGQEVGTVRGWSGWFPMATAKCQAVPCRSFTTSPYGMGSTLETLVSRAATTDIGATKNAIRMWPPVPYAAKILRVAYTAAA